MCDVHVTESYIKEENPESSSKPIVTDLENYQPDTAEWKKAE